MAKVAHRIPVMTFGESLKNLNCNKFILYDATHSNTAETIIEINTDATEVDIKKAIAYIRTQDIDVLIKTKDYIKCDCDADCIIEYLRLQGFSVEKEAEPVGIIGF